MPSNVAFSSRNSPVSIGHYLTSLNSLSYTFLYAHKWGLGVRVDELDVTTFEEFGFSMHEDGVMDADVSFDGFWSVKHDSSGIQASSNNAFDQAGNVPGLASIQGSTSLPPLLYPGTTVYDSNLFVKGRASGYDGQSVGLNNGFSSNFRPSYNFPSMKLFSAMIDSVCRGVLSVSFSAKNQGAFYFPGQAVTSNPRGIWH